MDRNDYTLRDMIDAMRGAPGARYEAAKYFPAFYSALVSDPLCAIADVLGDKKALHLEYKLREAIGVASEAGEADAAAPGKAKPAAPAKPASGPAAAKPKVQPKPEPDDDPDELPKARRARDDDGSKKKPAKKSDDDEIDALMRELDEAD